MGGCLSDYGGGVGGLKSAICRGDGEAAAAFVRRNRLLLEAVVDCTGNGPLHLAVIQGAHDVLTQLLSLTNPIEKLHVAQKVRPVINQGRLGDSATPLMLACDIGDLHAVSLLLQAGANPSARDHPYRKTCLHYAVAKGHVSVISAVAEHSCSRASTCLQPRTAPAHAGRLQAPAHAGRLQAPGFPRTSPSDSKMSIHKGDASARPVVERPFLDLASSGGLTAVMIAAACNQPAAIQELVLLGADPWLSCWDHNTDPLCKAAQGSTALHIAASHGALQAAQALMEECVFFLSQPLLGHKSLSLAEKKPVQDPRLAADCQGRTPFCLAQAQKHRAMAALLDPRVPVHLLHDMVQHSIATHSAAAVADPGSPTESTATETSVGVRITSGIGRYLKSACPKGCDEAAVPGYDAGFGSRSGSSYGAGSGSGHSSPCQSIPSLQGSLQGVSARLSTVYEAEAGEAPEEQAHDDQSCGGAGGARLYARASTSTESVKERGWSARPSRSLPSPEPGRKEQTSWPLSSP